MMRHHIRSVCPCGWSHEPPFGSEFLSRSDYPVCPDCGLGCSERSLVTGRLQKQPRSNWWQLFSPNYNFVPTPPTQEKDDE